MLQQKIRADMENAMRSRDMLKLDTLRMLISAMTNEMKASGHMLVEGMDDAKVVTLIRREVKKRKEAEAAFKTGGRSDSAAKEESERVILEEYLPASMSAEAVLEVVKKKKEDLGITDKKDAGILIGRVMKELDGKVDGGTVKAAVDSLFS